MALLGVRLDEKLHREFKILCVRKDQPMTVVVKQLVEEWVAEQKEEVDGKEKETHARI